MFLFQKKKITEKKDEELLLEYRISGNKEIFSFLFQRYAEKVLYACAFYFEDKEKAKDAVMQIFFKLMEELLTRQIENFKGWLSFVVRNHCISELRKEKSSLKKHAGFYEFKYQLTNEEEESRIAKIRDEHMLQHMQDALLHLKDNQRVCVSLFYLQQQSYQQISDATGYSVKEVKSYIQNGKRNLKLKIEEGLHPSNSSINKK